MMQYFTWCGIILLVSLLAEVVSDTYLIKTSQPVKHLPFDWDWLRIAIGIIFAIYAILVHIQVNMFITFFQLLTGYGFWFDVLLNLANGRKITYISNTSPGDTIQRKWKWGATPLLFMEFWLWLLFLIITYNSYKL